jgi:antitoxin component YwqK of YwqJK toxin-antitoxin module
MKRILLFLAMALIIVSCAPRLTEKVEAKHSNGQPQVVRYYDKSDKCVKEIEYYETGEVKMEGAMKDGKREGTWKAYLRDGRPWSIDEFKNGDLDGSSTVYWENGNLRWEGKYKAGKHVGHWKWYDEQGILLREEDYPE